MWHSAWMTLCITMLCLYAECHVLCIVLLKSLCWVFLCWVPWRPCTELWHQQNSTQQNDIQHYWKQVFSYCMLTLRIKGLHVALTMNDTLHNIALPLCWVSRFMYCSTKVIMLSVFMLSAVAPMCRTMTLSITMLCLYTECRVLCIVILKSLYWVFLCWVPWCPCAELWHSA